MSINIEVKTEGYGFLCQTPGNWGKLPDKFKNFWEVDTEVYLDLGKHGWTDYKFDKSSARRLFYFNDKPKDTQHVCAQLTEKLPVGMHVLTVVPTSENRVILSVLLLP